MGMRSFVLAFALLSPAVAAAQNAALERMLGDFAAATGQSSLLDAGVPAPPAPAAGRKIEGKLVLVYEPGRTGQAKKWERLLKQSRILEDAVEKTNARFSLPHDLAVEAKQCGEANAWYKADERKITICYEEPAAVAKLLAEKTKSKKQAEALALGDLQHTFYHELGHALIDIFDIPSVGREEDAVDQFATLTLLRQGEDGEIAARVAATQFRLSAQHGKKNGEPLEFWDEHSFDKQRYYDTLCLIYGKDPGKYADLVPKKLPAARAERCQGEYEHLDAAWQTLLKPHEKPSTPLS